jgi:hypothetical protein
MDVFIIATELLGKLELTSGQLGQLRALEYRLLLESLPPRRGASKSAVEADPGSVPENEAALRARVVEEIMQMLTPEQRAQLSPP